MSNNNWLLTGWVHSVSNDKISFWLGGFDELQTVKIVDTMPEWLLVVDMGFRTSIPRSCVTSRSVTDDTVWGEFTKQDYQDLTELELWMKLSEL